MSTAPDTNRLHDLDGVRAFALLLGVAFHAGLSFLPFFIGWAVMDVSTSPVVGALLLTAHAFRMPLFFLIAGYFSRMSFHRRGPAAFVGSRVLRLGVPFIAGWFLLRPLLVSGWIMGAQSMRGEVDVLAGLRLGFAELGKLPEGLFVGTHLWFLYYLLLISATAIILRTIVVSLLPSVGYKLTTLADAGIRRAANSRLPWLLVIPTTALCLHAMDGWGIATPDRSLRPIFSVSTFYALFFLSGWLLHRHDELRHTFTRVTPARVGTVLIAGCVTVLLSAFESQPDHPHIDVLRAVFCISYATLTWSMIGLTMGIFRQCCRQANRLVRYLADAAYWIYLVHLPIVVWLQVALAEWPLHWSVKLTVIFAVTTLASILVYDLAIRPTCVGQVLNGRRRPSAIRSMVARRREAAVARATT